MSPSRGDAGRQDAEGGPEEVALRKARVFVRQLLHEIHVLDALPERSRVLAVDAELPVHNVLAAVLSEQHPQLNIQRPPAGYSEDSIAPDRGQMLRREGGPSPSPRGAAEESRPLACGIVSPALPSNVLAEVCEFDPSAWLRPHDATGAAESHSEAEQATRRWTSPDDGWGTHLSIPVQDLEKMPMGRPVTVGELADFLAYACEQGPTDKGAPAPQRWAELVGLGKDKSQRTPEPAPGEDLLDWSLAQWRALKSQLSPEAAPPAAQDGEEAAARLVVEEPTQVTGPVLVHQVPNAPPRPILCTDDPGASVLKAVQLLLAFPALDAVPVVSPVRCTVVAHLTLSYCLAHVLSRLRGVELRPLASVRIGGALGPEEGSVGLRKFTAASVPDAEGSWAERRVSGALPWVLRRSQTLGDLLTFFARTHYNGVPIVEDGDGLIGLISRRDLLNYVDLAMQSARKRVDASFDGLEPIKFDVKTPIEAVMAALRRYRSPSATEEDAEARFGAALIYEKDVPLKTLLLRLLTAENRIVLFVKGEPGAGSPRLLRVVSISDVWRALIGSEQDARELSGMAQVVDV